MYVALWPMVAASISLVLGVLIALFTRSFKRELKSRDGFLLVTLAWVLMSASAAVPLLTALPDLSFTDAYFGVGGMPLYRAETPGPIKDEKLTPRITETAKALWISYGSITLVGIVVLRIAGMSWFDAICHAFSAMGLGGFSTHDSSVGYFDSALILIFPWFY